MKYFAPTGWSKLHDEFKIYAGYFRPAKIQHVVTLKRCPLPGFEVVPKLVYCRYSADMLGLC